jgi:hypothetical protein
VIFVMVAVPMFCVADQPPLQLLLLRLGEKMRSAAFVDIALGASLMILISLMLLAVVF